MMLLEKYSKHGTKCSKPLDFMKNKKFYTAYSYEILNTLFEKEKQLVQIRKRSDQLSIRPTLIPILQQFARQHKYSLATLHLGIYFLDVYMDCYVLSEFEEHQKLIGLVCLLLAAKSEDVDDQVPSIKDLLKMIDLSEDLGVDLRFKEEMNSKLVTEAYQNFSMMYAKLEFLIFETLNFNTIRPTALSFMNIFQNLVLTESDVDDVETGDDQTMTLSALRLQANAYLKTFLDIILIDIDFFNVRPSKLAAAIVGAIRKLLKIKNFWPEYIIELTTYEKNDIRSLMIILLEKRFEAVYRKEEEDDTMRDSGFISVESGSETEEQVKRVFKKRKLNRKVEITFEAIN